MADTRQPTAGIIASIIIMAFSLALISFFQLSTFTGWVAYCIECLIPMQIVIGIVAVLVGVFDYALTSGTMLMASTPTFDSGACPTLFATLLICTWGSMLASFYGWTTVTRPLAMAG